MKRRLLWMVIVVLALFMTGLWGCGNSEKTSLGDQEGGEEVNKKIEVDDEEYYNLNIHVSNFTEASLESYEKGIYPAEELLNFAYQYNWFNIDNAVEIAEDYYFIAPGNNFAYNTRVSDHYLNAALEKFFGEGITVESLSGTYEVDQYMDGYYYSEETGGNIPMGFALLYEIEKTGDEYLCSYRIYGAGSYAAYDREYYGWSHAQAEETFGEHYGSCKMRLRADDLKNRDSYEILSYERIGI